MAADLFCAFSFNDLLLSNRIVMAPMMETHYPLRSCFAGACIANNGHDLDRAKQAVANGDADLVSFGLPFLGNADLVRSYRQGLPLNTADPATFYGGDENGYTDYPAFTGDEVSAA